MKQFLFWFARTAPVAVGVGVLFVVGVSVGNAYTWTPPTAPYPNGQPARPLDESGNAQQKIGQFTVGAPNQFVGFNASFPEVLFTGASKSSRLYLTPTGLAVSDDFTTQGRLGVGTSTPAHSLDVAGDFRVAGSTSDLVTVKNTGNGEADVSFSNTVSEWQVGAFGSADNGAFGIYGGANGVQGARRLIITTDGNVGIGTVSPAYTLDVAGNARFLGAVAVPPPADGTHATNKTYVDSAVSSAVNSKLFWFRNGTDTYLANNSDNVGIGTTTPSVKLSVVGKVQIVDNTESNGRVLTSDASGVGTWKVLPSGLGGSGTVNKIAYFTPDGNTVSSANTIAYDATQGTLEFGSGVAGKETNAGKIGYQSFTSDALDIVGAGTNGANRKIKFWNEGGAFFTGNVGIGTDNPGNKLSVVGARSSTVSASTAVTKIGGSDVYLYSNAMDSAPWGVWTQVLDNSGVPYPLVLNPVGGNVGIGTSNPGAKLDVAGQIKITDGTQGDNRVLTSNESGLASWVDLPVAATPVWTTSGNNIFNANPGNVGIGTQTPTSPLTVQGEILSQANGDSGYNAGNISLKDIANGKTWDVTNRGGSDAANRNKLMFFYNDGTSWQPPRFTIDTNGSVGIGTSNPSAKFQIEGDTNDLAGIKNTTDKEADVSFSNTVSEWQVGAFGSADNGAFGIYGGANGVQGARRLMISTDGNVGIGTAAPQEKFHIEDGSLLVGKTNGDRIILTPRPAGSGAVLWTTNNAKTEYEPFRIDSKNFTWTSGSTGNNVVFDTNGNVGIGIDEPTAQLHVKGGHSWGTDIKLDATGIDGGKEWLIGSTGGDAGEGKGKFIIKNQTDDHVRLLVTADGNVGIGSKVGAASLPSSFPKEKLSVYNGNILVTAGNLFFETMEVTSPTKPTVTPVAGSGSLSTDYGYGYKITYGTEFGETKASSVSAVLCAFSTAGEVGSCQISIPTYSDERITHAYIYRAQKQNTDVQFPDVNFKRIKTVKLTGNPTIVTDGGFPPQNDIGLPEINTISAGIYVKGELEAPPYSPVIRFAKLGNDVRVGINTERPAYTLDVNGAVRTDAIYTNRIVSDDLKVTDTNAKNAVWNGLRWLPHNTSGSNEGAIASCGIDSNDHGGEARINNGVIEVRVWDSYGTAKSDWAAWGAYKTFNGPHTIVAKVGYTNDKVVTEYTYTGEEKSSFDIGRPPLRLYVYRTVRTNTNPSCTVDIN